MIDQITENMKTYENAKGKGLFISSNPFITKWKARFG